jgi:glycosyltransferase involved in cell wall biosynthesis
MANLKSESNAIDGKPTQPGFYMRSYTQSPTPSRSELSEGVVVSVATLTYGRPLQFARCFESVVKACDVALADGVPIEYLVIEDPESRSYSIDLIEQKPLYLRTVRNPTRCGQTHCSNIALDEARGDFLLFVDDDAVIEPNLIVELSRTMRESHAGTLGPVIYYLNSPKTVMSYGALYSRWTGRDVPARPIGALWNVDSVPVVYMLNRAAILRLGLRFDERFSWGAEGLIQAHLKLSGLPALVSGRCKSYHDLEMQFGHFSVAAQGDIWGARVFKWRTLRFWIPLFLLPLTVWAYALYYTVRYVHHKSVRVFLQLSANCIRGILRGVRVILQEDR